MEAARDDQGAQGTPRPEGFHSLHLLTETGQLHAAIGRYCHVHRKWTRHRQGRLFSHSRKCYRSPGSQMARKTQEYQAIGVRSETRAGVSVNTSHTFHYSPSQSLHRLALVFRAIEDSRGSRHGGQGSREKNQDTVQPGPNLGTGSRTGHLTCSKWKLPLGRPAVSRLWLSLEPVPNGLDRFQRLRSRLAGQSWSRLQQRDGGCSERFRSGLLQRYVSIYTRPSAHLVFRPLHLWLLAACPRGLGPRTLHGRGAISSLLHQV